MDAAGMLLERCKSPSWPEVSAGDEGAMVFALGSASSTAAAAAAAASSAASDSLCPASCSERSTMIMRARLTEALCFSVSSRPNSLVSCFLTCA